jgi:hypothetical protein
LVDPSKHLMVCRSEDLLDHRLLAFDTLDITPEFADLTAKPADLAPKLANMGLDPTHLV